MGFMQTNMKQRGALACTLQVLDMCAAPGSKTLQLLEGIHTGGSHSPASRDPVLGTPNGYVVANDVDARRSHLLTHHVKRVCSPCLIVTNHNAEQFPLLKR